MLARRSAAGFTLIELMIAVVVIAILTSIAYPSYRQHVVRSKRSAAQATMMDIANRQQQFLIANRRYADKAELEANGYVLPPEVSENYDWDVLLGAGGGPPTFGITLTPTGGQASDVVLTLNQAGLKTPADKWRR
jgi:type IV pilus assembly protein PilE